MNDRGDNSDEAAFIPPAVTAEVPLESLAASVHSLREEVVQLSDRLATVLNSAKDPSAESQDISGKLDAVMRIREERARLFRPSLFSDPAWDILLHLLRAEFDEVRMSFTRLAEQARIPATTANRWISIMAGKGMLIRHDDHFDARRTFVELHPNTSAALRELIGTSPLGSGESKRV